MEQSVSKGEYILYAKITVYYNELYNAILNKNIRNYLMEKNSDDFGNEQILKIDEKESDIDQSFHHSKFTKVGLVREGINRLDIFLSNKNISKRKLLSEEKRSIYLRKVCNHLYMIDFHTHPNTNEFLIDENINMSGKILLLQRLLFALFKDDHKVLIFSLLSKMPDIIELCAVDIIKKNPNIKLFLLSTRAGRLAKPPDPRLSSSYCLSILINYITCYYISFGFYNTIEEKILERVDTKLRLEKLVIHKEKFKSLILMSSKDNAELSSMFLFNDDAKKKSLKKGKMIFFQMKILKVS
ncbi:hypothetical protein PCK1_002188 [Pneumocystis canis]|nr:hypothetical protein PCK1_002188 [Pneumocystis canis]